VRAHRDTGKLLVRDVQRDVTIRQELEHEQQRVKAMEMQRRRGPEISYEPSPETAVPQRLPIR